MKLIEDYLTTEQTYIDKYGRDIFLLFQVGSFFELYCLESDMSRVRTYSSICDLKVTTKNEYHNGEKVWLCGFHIVQMDDYIKKVHPYGHICVVYVQSEETKSKKEYVPRNLYQVFTPATTFIDESPNLSNNISCIWIQKSRDLSMKQKYIFGLSNIDIYTGKSDMCEYYEEYYHNPTTYDNIEKFLSVYNPIELIFIYNIEESVINNIVQYLNSSSKSIHKIDLNNSENYLSEQAKKCQSQVYQHEIIDKFYTYIDNIETFKDSLFEKIIAFQSFCFLLNFVEQHNTSLVKKMKEPTIENDTKTLVCANHSLKQLNIIDNSDSFGDFSSIHKFLNRCHTTMGKRHMKDILLNPICDITTLNMSYDTIEHFISMDYDFSQTLNNIKDIEKIMTKMKLKKTNPYDYAGLFNSTTLCLDILNQITDNKLFKLLDIKRECVENSIDIIMNKLNSFFNIDVCSSVPSLFFEKYPEYNHKIIKKGNFVELDNIIKKTIEDTNKLDKIIEFLNEYVAENGIKSKGKKGIVNLYQTASGDMHLLITKTRKKKFVDIINSKNNTIHKLSFVSESSNKSINFDFDLKELSFIDYNKSEVSIHSPIIDKIVKSLYKNKVEFHEILNKSYSSIHDIILSDIYNEICLMIEFIKSIDIFNNKALISKQYNYSKPSIQERDNSYIDIQKLRHPLIEHIETNELYVSNDICLGDKETNLGILLFGTNAVGKTSLIRSIGIAVIMAQSGMYVSCESMSFMPYKYIFTRIIGNDNLFKGLSTFGVEMSELRVILNNCDENSLILGDELCSGTEIDSALSIFISSLEIMSNRKSNFIFATHFHQVVDFEEVKQMDSISMKHMKVLYNNETGKLVYDRKLQEGSGESIYGLEVCKSLNMPQDFIKRCYEVRNKQIDNTNNVLAFKVSKYNKNKLRGMCEFCKKEKASETHHLQYQQDANDNDYINNAFHKNHKANLASICEKCHDWIHANDFRCEKRKTSDGYEIILNTS